MIASDKTLWAVLGIDPDDAEPRSVPVRVRMDPELVQELDRIVSFAEARDVRLTRSDLIRSACVQYVAGWKAATDDDSAATDGGDAGTIKPRPGAR